jgi:hypothetical protein
VSRRSAKGNRESYRIGDAVVLADDNAESIIVEPEFDYADTIGYEYIKYVKSTGSYCDYDALYAITNNHVALHGYDTPKKNELVIHIRAGDGKSVGAAKSDTWGDTWCGGLNEILSVITRVVGNLKPQFITIVTVCHYSDKDLTYDEYIKYGVSDVNVGMFNKLFKHMDNIGVPYAIRSSNNVDADLAYIIMADTLIITNGNFSMLGGICCRGKVVFGRACLKNNFDEFKSKRLTSKDELLKERAERRAKRLNSGGKW